MSAVEKVGLGLAIVFLAVALLRIFAAPLKTVARLFFHSALGFAALWLVNFTSGLTGITLGLNLFNAVTIGILGLPGLGLLLLLQWILT